MDRPIGIRHPKNEDIIYPINHVYVDGVFASDGEEQDVYILGPDKPFNKFEGTVIAIYHHISDIEDKWIVSLD